MRSCQAPPPPFDNLVGGSIPPQQKRGRGLHTINSDHVVVSASIYFPSNSQRDALFHRKAYDYSEWVRVGIDVYIPHRKYQVKPHSSPWFSASCAVAIVHRNQFFHLYQNDKSSDSKVKFRQASNCCKRALKAAKLAYANKTKESITFQKVGSQDFWQIANSVLNEGKSAVPPPFNNPEMLSSASDKAKLFAENFSKNSNLDDSGITLPVFPSRTHLKLHGISVLPEWLKRP